MKCNYLINDYKALLRNLVETGEDMLDMDEISKAQGLSIAAQMLSDLIKFHEEEFCVDD